MKNIVLAMLVLFLAACAGNSKDFSSVKTGMSSQQVLLHAGEPDQKHDIGVADLWIYEKVDRTVVFRQDTVYDIITSSNARIDSIEMTLDHLGDKIENQAEKAVDKIDSLGNKLKKKLRVDSLKN